jgi:putative transcriptional regulator
LTAALLLTVALVTVIAADERSATADRPSLTGRLLVATDALRDPRFARTVIFVVRHDAGGAFGLIVNLPIAEVPFERALRPFGLDVPPGSGTVRVYYGGPVQEQRGFVLHTPDWTGKGTAVIDDRFALTEDPKVLQAMAQGVGPRRALFCLGYAGWAPGQLDAELGQGVWGVAPADERLVFDEDPQAKWIEATTRRRFDL